MARLNVQSNLSIKLAKSDNLIAIAEWSYSMIQTLARWLARKAVKAEWKAKGRNIRYAEIGAATNAYFLEHRNELLRAAWEHPVVIQHRQQERMRLARKAVIAEIREKGRTVRSIEPAELKKLIDAYLEEHPEESVIRTWVCY